MAASVWRTLAKPTRHRLPHQPKRFTHSHQKEARSFPTIFTALGVLGGATFALIPSRKSTTLNDTTFTPYTITARDLISPTSVLFTISPRQHDPSPPYLLPQSQTWRYPLWSVEFKQPEVQIARHYTPLPPRDDEDPRDGQLRFYVRAVGGGEMSNYLNRLGVGREVYLRGPHAGFDVLGRLGSCKNVVFLAGGTGVVPGMQVAKAVLDRDDSSRVELLWAVRKREEIQSGVRTGTQPWWKLWAAPSKAPSREMTTDLDNPSAVAKALIHLKAKFGERLLVKVAVDEECTRFTPRDIQSVLSGKEQSTAASGRGCQLHDQLLHTRASEFQDSRVECKCTSENQPGKNLFMVSGPDGFIAHYAGEKIWRGGTLTQGPVGGVAGELQQNNPSLANGWLVLKL